MIDTVRLVVNASRCDGHGICALRCPELVALDQWGFAAVESRTVTDARVVRRARRAVAACPRRALTLEVLPPAPTAPHLVEVPFSVNDGQQKNNASSDIGVPHDNGGPCHNNELATSHNRNHEAG